jgi:formiminotetrahydrofolate cyclodeaminase
MSLPVIGDLTVTGYLSELAGDSLFPAAGSSAGLTAAQGAALLAMVCRVNLRKLEEGKLKNSKSGADSATEPGRGESEGETLAFWQRVLEQAERLTERCLELAQEDGAAYRDVVDGDPKGPAHALEVPLEIARRSLEITGLIRTALPRSYAPVRADAMTALALVQGSFRAGLVVARCNLPLLHDEAERENYVNLINALKLKADLDPVAVAPGAGQGTPK